MQSTIFDQAVASLTNEERAEMLKRITGEANYQEELALNVPEEKVLDANQLIEAKDPLNWWEKLKLFFLTFFFREDPERSLEVLLLTKSKTDVSYKAPGYVDFNSRKFLAKFGKQLEQMTMALEVFRRPLSDALGEHRQEFYALLGAEESPVLQAELARNSNPNAILELHPNTDNATLRSMIERSCDDILREIGNSSRQSIRLLTRTLIHLERLVNFNFDKCLALYSKDGTCSFDLLVKSLEKLDDILYSFTMRPPVRLLQLLFTFSYHAQRVNPNEMDSRLADDLKRASEAMALVTEFNRYPLTKTIKVIKGDFFYHPNSLTGGEDWFNLYKKFWRNRIELSYRFFISKRKMDQLLDRACEVLTITEIPAVPVYSSGHWPETFAPIYPTTFSLLSYFYQNMHKKICEKVIRPVLDAGTFYRRENRIELFEANATLFTIAEEVDLFLRSLDVDGEVGNIFVTQENNPKQLETVTTIASRSATAFIHNTVETLRVVSLVLQGVIQENSDQQYGTISNMADLDIRFPELRMDLGRYTYIINQMWVIMTDLRDVEERLSHIESASKSKVLDQGEATSGTDDSEITTENPNDSDT
ncbi:MAG: DUF5312 family protein [Spirochaetia bacterium]